MYNVTWLHPGSSHSVIEMLLKVGIAPVDGPNFENCWDDSTKANLASGRLPVRRSEADGFTEYVVMRLLPP